MVNIYYARKTITLTFDPNGGKFGESNEKKTVRGKYGETVTDNIVTPSKADMKFDGWKSEKENNPPATFPEKDTTYTAQWKPRESANYTVRHWKQPILGDTYTDKVEESLSGIVDEDTQAQAKTYQNFHLSKVRHVDGKIVQQKIKADGLTIVDIYYDRNIFTAKFNTDGGNSISDISGRYEADLLPPAKPTKEGKEFVKWEPPVPARFTVNTEHKAIWKDQPAQQATYTVEHWTQKVDPATGKVCPADTHTQGNYDLRDKDTGKTGKIGELTAATARTDEKFKGYEPPTVTQETIKADGSTVVKIYYVRKAVMLTFDAKGGKIGSESTKILTGKYGEKIQEAEVGKPEKDDADFDAWTPLLPQKFPEENAGYEATWKIVKELEIKDGPSKKEYAVGEKFDAAGLSVYVKYTEAPQRLITKDEYLISGFDSSAEGIKTITVTYKKKSATFTVTVKTPTPPSETYAFGDIVDKDGKKYKASTFSAPIQWENYYVIIKVEDTKYIGVRYFDNTGYGDVELGTSISNTYRNQPDSNHRYLKKDEVESIFSNKQGFKDSIKKIKGTGIPADFDKQNCIYKGKDDFGDDTFFNGNNIKVVGFNDRDILPIIAREFN